MKHALLLLVIAAPAAAQLDGGARSRLDAGARPARTDGGFRPFTAFAIRPDAGAPAQARPDAGARANLDASVRRARRDAGQRIRRGRDAGVDAWVEEDAAVEEDASADAALALDAASDAAIEPDAAIDDAGIDAAVELDAGTDAGPVIVDAGTGAAVIAVAPRIPAPAVERPDERDLFGRFSAWFYEREREERAEQAREDARREREPSSTITLAPLFGDQGFWESIGLDVPEGRISTFGLIVLFALLMVAHWALSRVRRRLPERGLIPRWTAGAYALLRGVLVLIALVLVARALPPWLRPALIVLFVAAAVAAGWSAWVLVPDLVAGLVLLAERRVRPGRWIEGSNDIAGTVEHIGLRITILRREDGSEQAIPNRALLASTTTHRDREPNEIVVTVRAPAGVVAERMRAALRAAVIGSPYVTPRPGLQLWHDPVDPERWRLRARLLDAKHAEVFESELRERIDEALANDVAS